MPEAYSNGKAAQIPAPGAIHAASGIPLLADSAIKCEAALVVDGACDVELVLTVYNLVGEVVNTHVLSAVNVTAQANFAEVVGEKTGNWGTGAYEAYVTLRALTAGRTIILDRLQIKDLTAQSAASRAVIAANEAATSRDEAGIHEAEAARYQALAATARDDAGRFATSISDQIETASGYVDEARAEASAAREDRLKAETAQGSATAAQGAAVTAMEDADSAANAAKQYSELAVQVHRAAGQAATLNIFPDPYFDTAPEGFVFIGEGNSWEILEQEDTTGTLTRPKYLTFRRNVGQRYEVIDLGRIPMDAGASRYYRVRFKARTSSLNGNNNAWVSIRLASWFDGSGAGNDYVAGVTSATTEWTQFDEVIHVVADHSLLALRIVVNEQNWQSILELGDVHISDVTLVQDAKIEAAAAVKSAADASSYADDSGAAAEASREDRIKAETARGSAEEWATSAANSYEDAEEAASTAIREAGISTQARTEAEEWAESANQSRDTASSFADDAKREADAARESVLKAQVGRSFSPILPSTFDEGLIHFTTKRHGPVTDEPWAQALVFKDANEQFGNVADWRPTTTGHNVLTRGVVPANGRTFRITVDFQVRWIPAGVGGKVPLNIYLGLLDRDYQPVGFTATALEEFSTGFHTISRVVGPEERTGVTDVIPNLLDPTVLNLRAGPRLAGNFETAPVIHIGRIIVEDVTNVSLTEDIKAQAEIVRQEAVKAKEDAEGASSEAVEANRLAAEARDDAEGHKDDASGYASSANEDMKTASAKAGEAGTHAEASRQERLKAETARDDAEDYRDSASISRDDAVKAKEDAEGAATLALSRLELNAEIARTDNSVLTDIYMETALWRRWASEGTVSSKDNEFYPLGKTWDISVANGQKDGLQLNWSNGTYWRGARNALGYVVDLDFSHIAGSLGTFELMIRWNTTDGYFEKSFRLNEMVKNTSSSPIRQGRAIFKRPDNYNGTFASHSIYIIGNYHHAGAARIKLHRLVIRPATDEELGQGEILASVSANLLSEYKTWADSETAVAGMIDKATANVGDIASSVEAQGKAIADLEDGAKAGYLIKAQAGDEVSLLSLVAADGSEGSVSVAKMEATDILLKGSVTMEQLLITDMSGNLTPYRPWSHGDFKGWGFGGDQNIESRQRDKDHSWGELRDMKSPYAAVFKEGNSTMWSDLFSVEPGDRLSWSYWAAGAGTPRSRRIQFGLRYYDENGVYLSGDYTVTDELTQTVYTQFTGAHNVPDDAVQCRVWFRCFDTGEGAAYVSAPKVHKRQRAATLITDDSIHTGLLDVDSLSVAGLSVFGGALASANYDGNGTGWRITRGGLFEIPHANIGTLELAGQSVSTQWSVNGTSLNINPRHAMEIVVMATVRVAGTGSSSNPEYILKYRGNQVDQNTFSASPYSWNFVQFITLNVPAGTHNIRMEFNNVSDNLLSKQRLVVMGKYR